jgi:hypothetical protein
VTSTEWLGFEEHFDQRKVELGGCARPYATTCQHEHACLRCPMISINPKMLPRLDEIEGDLLARRVRAEAEGWLGEIKGIDLTLSFLRQKRDAGSGPLVNPFPLDRSRRGGRAHAHHNPMEPFRSERSGLYRPMVSDRIPRSVPDS